MVPEAEDMIEDSVVEFVRKVCRRLANTKSAGDSVTQHDVMHILEQADLPHHL